MDEDELRLHWQEQERSVRARMAASGVATPADMASRTGMAFFEAMSRGEIPPPPICELVDFVPIEFEPGRFVFQGTPNFKHYNPIGSVHGGYAATLLDSCVGCAVHTALPKGRGYTTLELKVNYVRPLTAQTGPVRAEGRVVNLGNQIAIAEGRLTDPRGKLFAYATTTCLVFALPT